MGAQQLGMVERHLNYARRGGSRWPFLGELPPGGVWP